MKLNTKKILIADDHEVFLLGLKKIIEEVEDWKVLATVKTGKDAIQESKENHYHLIILDYLLPDLNALQVAKSIRAKNKNVKILVLSSLKDLYLQESFRQQKLNGYIFKSNSPVEIKSAIKEIFLGNEFYSPISSSSDSKILEGDFFSNLTKREIEVAVLTSKGYSQKEIGEKMGISSKTVEVHKRNLKEKLGKISDIELARQLVIHGYIQDDLLISVPKKNIE
jgi:two-component system invasion response regulator UvrY